MEFTNTTYLRKYFVQRFEDELDKTSLRIGMRCLFVELVSIIE